MYNVNIASNENPAQCLVIKKLKQLSIERWLTIIPFGLMLVFFIINEISYEQNHTKPIGEEQYVWAMIVGVVLIMIYTARYIYVRKVYNLENLLSKKLVTATLVSSTGSLLASVIFLIMPTGGSLSIATYSVIRLLFAGLLTVVSITLFIVHCFSMSATRLKNR